jgi:membrane-bound lytic murein transglycosylase B
MKYFVSVIFVIFFSVSNSASLDSPDFSNVKKNELSWNDWINKMKSQLEKENFKKSTIDILDDLTFNPRVIELDRKQPEFKLTFDEYLSKVIGEKKKKKINIEFNKNKELLKKIENKFNVNSKILVALWGIETSFGRYTGKFDILRSLASLSYDGRRTNFFQKELKNSLRIIDNGHFLKKDFFGSWAGAFGQTQFMPSTFIKYAVDFDGDNRKNLFKKPDALASGANYLNKSGWKSGITWGEKFDVKITKKMKSLSDKKQFKKINFWNNLGFPIKKNYEDNQLLRLVIPDSNFNECYLVSQNFDVILNWNRSNYFALTVFLFADEIN